ncbi:uncharacterized protein LOC126809538 [Patella vulgata]|uniref:uncharacterized protein LOC126809538 n=1 Tax=Patella vulgata TaxID=6465 RepID=UPI0024A840CB|nr:uncharacterized protein LOC126809538 [Patella vulgata]
MNLSNEKLLRQLSDKRAMTFLPAILYVGILMVVGLFGNSLVCFIIATKIYLIFDKEFDQDLRGSSLIAYNLFVRSYFVNAAW